MDQRTWPTGRARAVVINLMYEQWADGTAPGLGPMGNPLPRGVLDYQALSWARYGRTTGIFSLLSLLSEFGAHASVYASGLLAESAPDSLVEVVERGHELCGHGYSQDSVPASLTEDTERSSILTSLEALERCTGSRPSGWISPRCTPSPNTARLLAEAGVSWYGDVFDADLGYLERTAAGPIVALPFGMEVNDLPMLVRYGQPPRELARTFSAILAEQRHRPARSYLDVTVHAHVAGRPAGLAALRSILAEARAADDVWLATRLEIASCVEP